MSSREACPRTAAHGVVWSVVMLGLLVGCTEAPRLQVQVPRAPKTENALGSGTQSVPATATFDAPIVDANTWSGNPVGTGTFNVALSPAASGGPTSLSFTDPQGTDRYLIIGDFNASSGFGLAVISNAGWALGSTTVNGTTTAAVVFDIGSGDVVGVAQTGTLTLTAAGSANGQRVTGTLNAAFVPYSATPPACQVDADCSRGQVCQSGQCVQAPPPPACTSNAQCAAGQQCVAGQCATIPSGCTTSAQCTRGEQCVSGQCVPVVPGCTSNAQCSAGQQCVSGQCVPVTSGCTSNAQCPSGLVCQAGACVRSPPAGTCAPKRGSGSYTGTFGSVSTCSALGSGTVTLSSGMAAIDEDQGQLALYIVDSQTQQDGLIIELNACPAPASTTAGLSATLFKASHLSNGIALAAQIPGTASVVWTQVGASITGTATVTLISGGTVTGSFNVQ